MSFLIKVPKGRTTVHRMTYTDASGTAIAIATTDVPRVKLYRRDAATPDLDLDKNETANSSVVTVVGDGSAGQVDVTFAQGDTSGLSVGIYDVEASLVDDSETVPADAIKHAENGVAYVVPTGGGDVALA